MVSRDCAVLEMGVASGVCGGATETGAPEVLQPAQSTDKKQQIIKAREGTCFSKVAYGSAKKPIQLVPDTSSDVIRICVMRVSLWHNYEM